MNRETHEINIKTPLGICGLTQDPMESGQWRLSLLIPQLLDVIVLLFPGEM